MSFFDDRGNLGPPPEAFRFGQRGEFRSPIPLKLIGIAAAILVLYIVLNVLKSIYVDLLWFDSVGFSGIYRTVIVWKIGLFAAGALVAAAVIGGNILLARRFAPQGIEESFIEEIDVDSIRRVVTILMVAATIFLGVIFGTATGGAWETILTWRNAVPFGMQDAQFDKDPSFYIFTLPAYHFIQSWLLGLVVVAALAAGGVYGLSLSLQRSSWQVSGPMRIHLSVLAGVALLLVAAGTYLGIYGLVNSGDGIIYGATYTDVQARLPVRYILTGLAAAAGLVTIANAFLTPTGYRLPVFVIGLWLFVGFIGGIAYPGFVQRFQVDPNERAREQQYIGRNIEATRFAYGLNVIDETTYPANEEVSREEMDAHPQTIENIRILDPVPLRETFNSIQAIRPFYVFNDIDVDRYTIDGKIQQVMIAARELDILRAQDRNWTRERLQLTHGYGAVVSPVNEVGQEGLPELLIGDIPPQSEQIPITPDGARIYFGESTNQYVIANSVEPEFDYPLGEGNAETFYAEDRGITLDSFLTRFALAWELGDQNLLISGQIDSDSRLLLNRNIRTRIIEVAPFLRLDADPYLVLYEGELMWVQPAYTVASSFPYSQPSGSLNYIRHSVTVTVDAQSGDMVFYLTDPSDPVAATWATIFPDLFVGQETMPAELVEHLRYPLDMFKVQSGMYLRYHVTNPDVFFIGEDFWNIPTERFQNEEQPVEPYYVVMKLPEGGDNQVIAEEQVEFVLIMPFTPRNRPNTVAWLAGRSDGESFGALRAYRFPTDALVFGPAQIEARIDQHPTISQQISLWNQSGSEVIRGNLLMIPIGSSFLFVEPIYLQAENSRLPELVRVVVATGNKIAMEPTLSEAIEVILGERAATPPGAIDETPGTGGETPGATPTPEGTPGATVVPTGTPALPTGDLRGLLEDARDAQEATQEELDRLRAILDALERELEQQ